MEPPTSRELLIGAVVVVALLAVIYFAAAGGLLREGFASKQARQMASETRELYGKKPSPTYADFKRSVEGIDPVAHAELKNLHRKEELTPENVDKYVL